MRALLLALAVITIGPAARAEGEASPGVAGVPEGVPLLPSNAPFMPSNPTSSGAFSRHDRLTLGASWLAWSAASGLVSTGLALRVHAPTEPRLQTLALALPVGTLFGPVVFGSLWEGACGDGLDSPVARWRDAGAYGSVVFGVSWAVRALVAGALARPDATWPAYASAISGSLVEALGIAWLAAN